MSVYRFRKRRQYPKSVVGYGLPTPTAGFVYGSGDRRTKLEFPELVANRSAISSSGSQSETATFPHPLWS